jgi:ferrochelatase
MATPEKLGVLLINTGSTAAPRTAETRAYLREFLSDPRMLDKNPIVRWLVLNLFILPTRPKNSAEAYAAVWTDEGSPLIAISNRLKAGLEERMPGVVIEIGMRYGEPSIPGAFERLIAANVDRIIVAPLYPQYSSAANGSALELVYTLAAKPWNVPPIAVLPPFFDAEPFLDAWEAVTKPMYDDFKPDLLLMSYHGLPERHVQKSDRTGAHCLIKPDCCEAIVDANRNCYRAQCHATSRGLAKRLGIGPDDYMITFQSRLGREPWLTPATDLVLPELPGKGVKRLMIISPAFTADCLETLEELGIRAKEDFLAAGGEDFQLVPCPNDDPKWMDGLAGMLRGCAGV